MRPEKPAVLFLLVLLIAAGLAACDAGGATPTPARPTPARGPVPASAAGLRLVRTALAEVQTLTRFHYVLTNASEGITSTGTLEGDFIAPDQMYEQATSNSGYRGEQIYIGNKAYAKENGTWVEKPASSDQASFIQSFPALTETELYSYTQVLDPTIFDTQREESIAGTPTRIFSYTVTLKALDLKTSLATPVETAAMVGKTASTGTLWIDPATGHLFKLAVQIDLGMMGYVEQLKSILNAGDAARPRKAIPTPQPPRLTTNILTLTRHNDPSITLPTVP